MRHTIWLTFLLLAIAVAGIGFAAKLSTHGPELIKYEKEWVTALLQAGVVAVLGTVTTAVLELFKSGLQRSKDQSKLQLDAYLELRRRRHEVKLIRRGFQSSGSLTADDVTNLLAQQPGVGAKSSSPRHPDAYFSPSWTAFQSDRGRRG